MVVMQRFRGVRYWISHESLEFFRYTHEPLRQQQQQQQQQQYFITHLEVYPII